MQFLRLCPDIPTDEQKRTKKPMDRQTFGQYQVTLRRQYRTVMPPSPRNH